VPMNDEAVYLDSSAFVKLFIPEPDSAALTSYLASRRHRVSAMLLRTEALRTAVRAMLSPQRMSLVRRLLDGVSLIPADATLSDEAGILRPPELRSLDAIHLATARSLGTRLAALVTYDQRLAESAAWYGIPVASPC
jgi:predicted nucleic acid-binding protein